MVEQLLVGLGYVLGSVTALLGVYLGHAISRWSHNQPAVVKEERFEEVVTDEEIPDEQYFERARTVPQDEADLEGQVAKGGSFPDDEILEQLSQLNRHVG